MYGPMGMTVRYNRLPPTFASEEMDESQEDLRQPDL
jgi:hypothetical protein